MQPKQSQTFTYQTRVYLDKSLESILDALATLSRLVERKLFADISSGKSANSLKSAYLEKFKISARHFNSSKIQLEGKISSIKERRTGQIAGLKSRIEALESTIKKIEKRKNKSNKLHQKKRRCNQLRSKLKKLIADQEQDKFSLCFGSKKLFHAQFHLEANGYASHKEWLADWQEKRSNSFFLVGSKDEVSGNQLCVATIQENGKLTLRLRLPDALVKKSEKYLFIHDVDFHNGHDQVVHNLQIAKEARKLDKKSPLYKELETAMSYRFLRDEKGWRVFVTVSQKMPKWISNKELGTIGIDINSDHLAVTEIDRFGNPIKHKSIPLVCYGKSRDQARALIGDAVTEIVKWAEESRKPIVIEKLNFDEKKTLLKEQSYTKYARMLSSFSYKTIINCIKSRSFRCGVKIEEVNPAYTSIIGWVKFAERYGLSKHEAAALCIARRYLKLSERPPRHVDKVPDSHGGHVTFSLPARTREKHVWSHWRKVNKIVLAAHAAHIRAKRSSSQTTCCDRSSLLDFTGGTPARESSIALLD